MRAGLDELDEVVALALDEFLLERHEVAGADGRAVVFLEPEQVFHGHQGRAHERVGELAQTGRGRGELAEGDGVSRGEEREGGAQFVGRRQGDDDAGGAGVVHQQRVQIEEIVGDEAGRQPGIGQDGVAGPIAHEQDEGVEGVVTLAGRRGGGDEVGGAHPAANLEGGFAEAAEVGVVTEVTGQGLDGRLGLLRQPRGVPHGWPLGKLFPALFDTKAVAQVVGQDDPEARHEDVAQEIRQPAQRWAGGDRRV